MPVYLIFISFLGPKSGSGLPNTCLFSWIFSVKYFVEYLRPHLRTQGQFQNNVFCGVLILPFPLGCREHLFILLYFTYYIPLDLLIDRAFAAWISILPFIDHSRFLTILIVIITKHVNRWGPCVIPTLSNVTSTTKCILQWLILLLF